MTYNFLSAIYDTLMACGWSNSDADMFCDFYISMGNKAITLFTHID